MNQTIFDLDSKYIGVLPIVNHFLERLKFKEVLEKYLPPADERFKITPNQALGLLVRSLIVCRTPLYSVGEWAKQMVPNLLGLRPNQIGLLNDDRIGRALDRLFEADRSAMLTDFVVHMVEEFKIELEQFHNDSTTLTLHGEYPEADGHIQRGKSTLVVTFGHNKDHRPDLKQLLWILTISEDGAVPVHFKVADGNTQDSTTHIETWEVLRRLVGSPQFLYVADCKLCSRENLHHIHEAGGWFITVLPRTRKEDSQFKEWLLTHTPDWKEIIRYPHPRRKDGPPDIFRAVESPIPDSDGYRLIWFHSSHKRERDAQSRQDRIVRAFKEMDKLKAKLEGPRCRYTTLEGVELAVKKILSDGVFPLVTNYRDQSILDVLTAYKSKQPFIEKRHDLLKNTLEVTPAFLKNISRLEAFLFLNFVGITVHALIERELRKAMEANSIEVPPLYPEGRDCRAPTTARIIEIFGNLQRHILSKSGKTIQRFAPELSDLQVQIIALLRLPLGLFAVDT